MDSNNDPSIDRRTLLSVLGTGAATSLAGCSLLERQEDSAVVPVEGERALSLAEAFAPTLYFDEHEQWLPTDPLQYESELDGDAVVDGFDALEGYTAGGGDDEVAFYHVVEYEESPLAVVQYWFYSVFDQFTTNFHWHDWELLQVFVDTESNDPQLYVASSHSRSVPNNEFLDPDGDRRPRILSELGSHSSGLSVNDEAERFQRIPPEGGLADITNSVVEGIERIAAIPLAYGLPRDEGLALPYLVPELDGDPIYEHDQLPSVEVSDLIAEELTVSSLLNLQSPPTLPTRSTGARFDYEGAESASEGGTYELRPTSELEHIEAFTGPQLSFEFAIPEFAEDAVASHITTTAVPWQSPRYTDPASDISEPRHRQALSDRYEAIGDPSPVNQVVATVTNAVSAEEAPEDGGLTTVAPPLEMFALLQSEETAVPTFRGIAVVQDVPSGDHTLTINGAGVAAHSETVPVSNDNRVTVAGVEGEIPLVAQEHAVKLAVDPSNAENDLTELAVEDDFAGRLYDAPLAGPDAVYLHEGGAFTTEVRDSDAELGVFRVNPSDENAVQLDDVRTGKAPIASYLADLAAETRDDVSDAADGDDSGAGGNVGSGQGNAVEGLLNALDAVIDAARRAAENADAGNRNNANQNLETVETRLQRVSSRLEEARGSLPDDLARAADHRLDQADRRVEQALNADKL